MKDLFSDNVDIAIRITREPEQNYIAKLLTPCKFIICATPGYLKKHPAPKQPNDLRQHNCLVYSADPSAHTWPLSKSNQLEQIRVEGNLSATDSTVIRAAVLAGKGITRLPEYVVNEEVKSGKLVVLLEEYNEITLPVCATPTPALILHRLK